MVPFPDNSLSSWDAFSEGKTYSAATIVERNTGLSKVGHNTPVAATRFKKILRKVREKGGEHVWEILKDVVSNAAKTVILGR